MNALSESHDTRAVKMRQFVRCLLGSGWYLSHVGWGDGTKIIRDWLALEMDKMFLLSKIAEGLLSAFVISKLQNVSNTHSKCQHARFQRRVELVLTGFVVVICKC
jgi:hypothetical protein